MTDSLDRVHVKYLLERMACGSDIEAAAQGSGPRFLAFRGFIAWALERMERDKAIETLKLRCVTTVEIRNKFPARVLLLRHVQIDVNDRRLALDDDVIARLPYPCMGHGVTTLHRRDPVVARALALPDQKDLAGLLVQLAWAMDQDFDVVEIEHDARPS